MVRSPNLTLFEFFHDHATLTPHARARRAPNSPSSVSRPTRSSRLGRAAAADRRRPFLFTEFGANADRLTLVLNRHGGLRHGGDLRRIRAWQRLDPAAAPGERSELQGLRQQRDRKPH
jgi:hypothetical protein